MANRYIDAPEINDRELEKLAQLNCSLEELASHYGTTITWLHNNKLDVIKRGRDAMKLKLRQRQIEVALDNQHPKQVTMLIFLGKSMLGQSDKVEITTTQITKAPSLIELYERLNQTEAELEERKQVDRS